MSSTAFFASVSELATLTNSFSVNSVLTDPTTVTLTVTTPSAVSTSYTYALGEITRSSAGIYTKDITCSEAGEWQYVWTGTGSAQDVVAGTWTVWETQLGRLYATVEALKSRLGIAASDTIDDYELHAACYAASRAVEQICERTFWKTAAATVRTFCPDSMYELRLPEYNDLISVSALAIDVSGTGTYDTTWTAADYQLQPVNPAAAPETRPYTRISAVGSYTFPYPYATTGRRNRVQITGVYGWPQVPPLVRQAALVSAAEIFRIKDAPLGIAGFGELGVVRVRDNPKVRSLLHGYERNPLLVA